jgi:hypothetical protein
MLYDFLVDGASSPMIKSSSFSGARTPLHAASMSVEMHMLVPKCLNSHYW